MKHPLLGRILVAIWLLTMPGLLGDTVRASRGEITLPTYPWWPAVKHPYFRGTDKVNIYPYPMLDFLSREKTSRTYRTVVLENEYLRLTFLPDLGGKVHEVIDKTTGQPMFYVNQVIKPGLIGQCGAWVSGGIEWNTGPQGHTVGCMQPVPVEILPRTADGSQSVAIGETERIYGTKWTVVVTLRPGRSFIEERIRIYNPTDHIRPYYFWNCTAVPNTPGFRFIYPMTLGSDHDGTKFFQWPFHEGKDLTRGTNYQDASSIFAYGCDQDFFGSYHHDLQRGVVAYANRHQLPGKKAWTWGWGSYGRMHQMDLTDDDGPYNEVQTGPLLTQADVGKLDPHEVVSWQEWWYPVHNLDGFTFANRDLAVNATEENGRLRLRMMGSGQWKSVKVTVRQKRRELGQARTSISPRQTAEVAFDLGTAATPCRVSVRTGATVLAEFDVPLTLPRRQPPEPRATGHSPSERVRLGWQHYLFARFPEAEAAFRQALQQDDRSAEAQAGLALLSLDRDPRAALDHAQAALDRDPDFGLARYLFAAAALRHGADSFALDGAWQASLDPRTAVAGRALAARILIRRGDLQAAAAALGEEGPWQIDLAARNLRAFASLELNDRAKAMALARQNLEVDPLDTFARSILWQARAEDRWLTLPRLLRDDPRQVLELVVAYDRLERPNTSLRILQECYVTQVPPEDRDPILSYWFAYLTATTGQPGASREHIAELLRVAQSAPADAVFPHHPETHKPLAWAQANHTADGKAALYLGHLDFAHGRHAEGRGMWQRAASTGAAAAIAWRALGMASLTLDQDAETAAQWLTQAHHADPADAIVARDLARALLALADGAPSAEQRRELTLQVRDVLTAAFANGRGRSDFVALLARAQNRLGAYADTARLLDSVRITIWEGAREAHDLFVEAHVMLGEAEFAAGRPAEALRHFDRALEYPENLATGRMENTREAHIHYARGQALSRLGRLPEAITAWRQAVDEPASKDPKQTHARQAAQAALQSAEAPNGPPR
jgi:tetratricopeptide (TPR) repeat protein